MQRSFSLTGITAICLGLLIAGCTPTAEIETGMDREGGRSSQPATTGNREQVMSGLGVNANVHSWRGGELRPAIDKISALGDITWRVVIDNGDWESVRNPAAPPAIDWDYYTPIYETPELVDLWETIAYINTKPGQEVMLNVMGPVSQWMGGDHIGADMEDEWVRTMASMAGYGRTVKNLDFTLLAPLNEPDLNGIEGPNVGPEQYVRLLHKLTVALDDLGLTDMRLVGPDTALAENAMDGYFRELSTDAVVMDRLAYFAIHSYSGETSDARQVLAQSGSGLDFWVTEFSGPCPGCDGGAPNPADWTSASATALLALDLIQQGATGLLHYDAWDGYYNHHGSNGYWGLLAYDKANGNYSPRKNYFALQQLTRFVPRGSVRVPMDSGDARIKAVAFEDPLSGRFTVFGVNTSDDVVPARMASPDIAGPLDLASYITNATHDMEKTTGTSVSSGRIEATIQPQTIFTLSGIPTKG